MNLEEAIEKRHSVRQYTDKKIEVKVKDELNLFIEECNSESGLKIQLILNEEAAFEKGIFAKMGSFKNVKNYIAIVGDKSKDLDETIGYYGEKIVLKATQLGLNTCWVALTYNKKEVAAKIESSEKLYIVIAIGYGVSDGNSHKVKALEKLYDAEIEIPDWFINGVKSAQLAPTALNQQKFKFKLLKNNIVQAKTSWGTNNKIDLGIAKYHFEIGATSKDWTWG